MFLFIFLYFSLFFFLMLQSGKSYQVIFLRLPKCTYDVGNFTYRDSNSVV